MNKDSIRSYLETFTNAAVLIMCVLFLSSMAVKLLSTNRIVLSVTGGLEKGQQLPSINAVNYENSTRTLLIALNTECEHCTKQLPFYTRITQRVRQDEIQIVALFPNVQERVQRYAREHSFNMNVKDSVDFSQFHVAATPTLILLDQEGRVMDFWVGEIPLEEQGRVLESIATP